MNILLVLPKVFINLAEPEHFPVGMAYISSSLKAAGHNVIILNLNFEIEPTKKRLADYISDYKIEIVETGGLVTHFHLVKEIVDYVKEINPKIFTLIGGGLVTGDPEIIMKGILNADFGVYGEGEITNNEVSKAINGQIKYSEVNGLIYRKRITDINIETSECIKNPPRKEIQDLDSIPWPDYEGFQLDKMLEYGPKRYVTMSTGRSCKYNCTFCFHTSGQTYRQRSLDSFFDELNYLVKRYSIDNIYITDELFANDKKRMTDFCSRIKGYNILWAIQLRVNIVTRELLQELKDSGCIIISFGLESADDLILKSMRKGITIQQIEYALLCCYEIGISAHGAFIFGDINEDSDTIEKTLEWWKSHREYNIALALIQVYPGTELYKYAYKTGIIKDKLKFIKDGCPYINVSKLTDVEYKKLGIRLEMEQSVMFRRLERDVQVEETKKNRFNISGKCLLCSNNIVGKDISSVKITVIRCEKCGERYTIDPFILYKENLEENIVEIVHKYKKIAFWGNNNIFSAIYQGSNTLKNTEFILVDSNSIMWDQFYCGHKIYSDREIDNTGIDIVIVCDYTYDNYITNIVKTNYQNVSMIISAGDLIKRS